MKKCICLFLFVFSINIHARTQLSLNGVWDFQIGGTFPTAWDYTIKVPGYWDFQATKLTMGGWPPTAEPYLTFYNTGEAWYSKKFVVPNNGDDRIAINFKAVSYICSLYISTDSLTKGTLAGTHDYDFIPFEIDITDKVTKGASYFLQLYVHDWEVAIFELSTATRSNACNHYSIYTPILDMPVGNPRRTTIGNRSGIWQDVALNTYSDVSVNDIFVIPSFRNKTLTVEYTLKNGGSTPKTVSLNSRVFDSTGTALWLPSVTDITIPAFDTAMVTLTQPWSNPVLWQPACWLKKGDLPKLYYLEAIVTESGIKKDSTTQRFGFREAWAEGQNLILNGSRINVYGDNIQGGAAGYPPLSSPNQYTDSADAMNTYALKIIKSYLAVNVNIIRAVAQPAPDRYYAIADSLGLLFNCESPLFFSERNYHLRSDDLWNIHIPAIIEGWVKEFRNHPSVIIWSAENEGIFMNGTAQATPEKMMSIDNMIYLYDKSRLVSHDGDAAVNNHPDVKFANVHYPDFAFQFNGIVEKKGEEYSDDIYRFGKNPLSIPQGVGEWYFGWGAPGPLHTQIYGLWVNKMSVQFRGYRWGNFTDVRGFVLRRAVTQGEPIFAEARENIKKSLQLTTAFDHDYDSLPYAYDTMTISFTQPAPAYDEGKLVTRYLDVYNGSYRDTSVTLFWKIRNNAGVFSDSGRYPILLMPGFHVDSQAVTFQTPPAVGNDSFYLDLFVELSDTTPPVNSYLFIANNTNAVNFPVAVISADTNSGTAPFTVNFNSTGSVNATVYEWDFNYNGEFTTDATGPIASHEFTLNGNNVVALKAINDTLADLEFLWIDVSGGIIGNNPLKNTGFPKVVSVSTAPNPFNPTVKFYIALPVKSQVRIQIYNINGKLVKNLANKELKAGRTNITWHAYSNSSTVYFARVVIGNKVITKRLIFLK